MPQFLLPRHPDGTGLAYLSCSDQAAEQFRFDRIAAKYPELSPWLNADYEHLAAARHSNRCDAYRIAVPGKWSSGAWAKVRFRLSKGTPKKTLEVIAAHLDEERIDWLFFTNESGTQLRGARFRCHHISPAA